MQLVCKRLRQNPQEVRALPGCQERLKREVPAMRLGRPEESALLAVFLAAMFFVKRPWCRVLCPLGGLFSLFNRFSMVYLDCNKDACTDCKRCHQLCDINCQPDETANDARCIRCFECTKCGPKALAVKSLLDTPSPGEKQPDISVD